MLCSPLLSTDQSLTIEQERWQERQSCYTEKVKTKSRRKMEKIVKRYSKDMVQRWKEEMDTLLVYVRRLEPP